MPLRATGAGVEVWTGLPKRDDFGAGRLHHVVTPVLHEPPPFSQQV